MMADDDDLPPLSLRDLLRLARVIWSRDPDQARSTQTEDRDFREHFGCGVLVALLFWGLLLTTASLPDGGTLVVVDPLVHEDLCKAEDSVLSLRWYRSPNIAEMG